MSLFVISQILIGVAICTDIASFQFKQKVHILTCLLISCLLISLHFMCLGHWTAAMLGLVAAIRFITCFFTSSRIFLALFIGIAIFISALTYEGRLSIMGGIAAILGTVASFSQEDKQLRLVMSLATMLWIIHNYLAGSPLAVLMEVFFLSSNLVGYYKYYIKSNKKILK